MAKAYGGFVIGAIDQHKKPKLLKKEFKMDNSSQDRLYKLATSIAMGSSAE